MIARLRYFRLLLRYWWYSRTAFDRRNDWEPQDPLLYHMLFLALYWSRLIGFFDVHPTPERLRYTALMACVEIGTYRVAPLVHASGRSDLISLWHTYVERLNSVRSATDSFSDQARLASAAFDACCSGISFDPWSFQ